jgi:hypothetical protein
LKGLILAILLSAPALANNPPSLVIEQGEPDGNLWWNHYEHGRLAQPLSPRDTHALVLVVADRWVDVPTCWFSVSDEGECEMHEGTSSHHEQIVLAVWVPNPRWIGQACDNLKVEFTDDGPVLLQLRGTLR